jgi:hypothetical protein
MAGGTESVYTYLVKTTCKSAVKQDFSFVSSDVERLSGNYRLISYKFGLYYRFVSSKSCLFCRRVGPLTGLILSDLPLAKWDYNCRGGLQLYLLPLGTTYLSIAF